MKVSVDGEKVVVTVNGYDSMGYESDTDHYMSIKDARKLSDMLREAAIIAHYNQARALHPVKNDTTKTE